MEYLPHHGLKKILPVLSFLSDGKTKSSCQSENEQITTKFCVFCVSLFLFQFNYHTNSYGQLYLDGAW